MLAVTSDTDWAHQDIWNYMQDILSEYGIKATVFCTNKLSVSKDHEIAIHPFFKNYETEKDVLEDLLRIYPTARGIRSHRLRISSEILDTCSKLGLKYDSSYQMIWQKTFPFYIRKNLIELPIYFMDDLNIIFKKGFTLKNHGLHNSKDTLSSMKIFIFHPIHVYLNTNDLSHYRMVKDMTQKPDLLVKFRNKGKGTCSLFITLLDYIRKNDIRCYTLSEIARIYERSNMKKTTR